MTMIASIQILRAVAAMMVVVFHVVPSEDALLGAAGVDIFFVISGFIMWLVTAPRPVRPGVFLRHRIERVVPLYWLSTTLLAAAAGLMPWAFERLTYSTERLAMSLLFIPHVEPWTGQVVPVLVQGWTLNYEMFFYLVVAGALLVPVRRRLAFLSAFLGMLVLAGAFIDNKGPLLATYTSPLLLEFLAGLWLGWWWQNGFAPGFAGSLAIVAAALAGLAAAALIGSPAEYVRVVAWGLPALLLVAGALGLDRAGRVGAWRWLSLTGDASYAIYLTHTFVIAMLGKLRTIWLALPLDGLPLASVQIVVTVAACWAAGLAVHLAVERPMLGWLRRTGEQTGKLQAAERRSTAT